MELNNMQGVSTPPVDKPIGPEQLKKFTQVLQDYRSGLEKTKQRIIASENWWKLRNTTEEQKKTQKGKDKGFTSSSGWLHNVITSKHADAMESYPEPNILPREKGDKLEAQTLSAIIPCILEHNQFEKTYSDAMWQKCKTGTGVYKIIWDASKLNGLGDISIERVNILNLYWEPGIEDIQKSRYFFHAEMIDKDVLIERYPDLLKDRLKSNTFINSKFQYDDAVKTENKVTLIEVYYHKFNNGKQVLHYCKYVEDIVLCATENETTAETDELGNIINEPMAVRGLYDHGRYPYEFDPLFPIEGSPCGYGYVDICRNPQTEIDLMKTSFVKNIMVGATPRYFSRQDGKVNEEEFLDLSKPIVHVGGTLDENALRQIAHTGLDGNYIEMLNQTIQELRETSGNTETSTGNTGSGVTAASAIAALQEASGKGSRDSTQASYRVFSRIVEVCIELIRQFYDLPRQFRITGQYGQEQFISYSNEGIQPQHQGVDFGQDMGYRLPVFDIKVSAQRKSVYTKISQNELATQMFQMGFFNPQMADPVLMCLDMMDFDGKDELMQKVQRNGTLFQKLMQYLPLALIGAQATGNLAAMQQIQMDTAMLMGGGAPTGGINPSMAPVGDNIKGLPAQEGTKMTNARERANNASQPSGGRVVAKKGETE